MRLPGAYTNRKSNLARENESHARLFAASLLILMITLSSLAIPAYATSSSIQNGNTSALSTHGYLLGAMQDANSTAEALGLGWLPEDVPADARVTPVYAAALPTHFDWRSNTGSNWMTSVKNQGGCGSCVAFGAVGATEAQFKIQASNPGWSLDLSEQHLFSCGGGSCSGGWYISAALNYLKNYGTPDESCSPYQAQSGQASCSNSCPDWQSRAFKIASWSWVANNPSALQAALMNGPLVAGFTVYSDFFGYHGGVYHWDHVSSAVGGHAIVIVGYDSNEEYWIVKNSWGASWGENGYFRIGFREAGIENYAASIKVQAPSPPPSPSYPSDRWERLWYMYSGSPSSPWGQYLGSGPDESSLNFNNDWSSGTLAYSRSDMIGFVSSRTANIAAGKWTFTVVSDDGVRLFIDDQLVIDAWKVQAPTTYAYTASFSSAADHRLRLEYFENQYGAKVTFNMQVEAPPPSSSFPSDLWDRLWYVYSGTPSSPWGQYLGSGPDESNLNFDNDWGSGTLAYGRSDNVGFVSSRTVNLAPGTWTFTLVSDDGVRLYVDDQLVIDGWSVHPPTTYTYIQTFASTADHRLRLEYFENAYGAKLSFNTQVQVPPPSPSYPSDRWERLWYVYSGSPSSQSGQYLGSGPDESNLTFDNSWGSGTLAYDRSDQIGFVSSRTVNVAAGTWVFTVVSDDGVRLYVDDQLVIDAWKVQAPTTYTCTASFSSAADHRLRLEYFENQYGAKVSFNMEGQAPPPPAPSCSSPSYPSDRWERLWSVYSGSLSSPWGQCLGSGPDEASLNFNSEWGSGVVAYGRSDQIGFVSSRTVNIATGTWTFTVGGDDGVRLYVDDQLVIDQWKIQPYTPYTYTTAFSSTADHRLRLEYFENQYGAKVSFSMQGEAPPPSCPNPSYPSDRWERLWYVYSGSPASSWGECLGSGPDEANLAFDNGYGSGSIAYGRSDRVGFISSRTVSIDAGTWTFTVTGDDGIRLYVNDQLVIEGWKVQPPTTYTYTQSFASTADHQLRLEWFENEYGARVAFDMQPVGAEVGLKGEYYSSSALGQFTTKITERTDPTVNFDWVNGSPGSGVASDLFAVRWTGSLTTAASGTYTIYVTADDGVRVWIDGNLVIDAWKVQPPTEYSWTGSLSAGKHSIKIEYYENMYGAVMKLGWTMPRASKAYPIPSNYLSPT
jgi:hypothetical protein